MAPRHRGVPARRHPPPGHEHADPVAAGAMLEPVLGRPRFLALYVASLFAGSMGVMLIEPTASTVGASGAIFGLMGAAVALSAPPWHQPVAPGWAAHPHQPAHHLRRARHLGGGSHRRPGRGPAGRPGGVRGRAADRQPVGGGWRARPRWPAPRGLARGRPSSGRTPCWASVVLARSGAPVPGAQPALLDRALEPGQVALPDEPQHLGAHHLAERAAQPPRERQPLAPGEAGAPAPGPWRVNRPRPVTTPAWRTPMAGRGATR